MNYYKHHIGDYSKDTAHLTMLEDGAYRRLMDVCYGSERPLPLERRAIYRLARAVSADDRAAVDTVLQEFFREFPDGWRQKRCDEEIAKAVAKSDKARESAMLRWAAPIDAKAPKNDANASNQHANAYANASGNDANASKTDAKAMLAISHKPGTTPLSPSPKKKRSDKPRTPPPDQFEVTESMFAWAEGQGVKADVIPFETDQFLDNHRAKRSLMADWPAAWRTWMRNHVKFARSRGVSR